MFVKTKVSTCNLKHSLLIWRILKPSCVVMIHVDDLFVVGKRDHVLGNFLKELKAAYEISVQCIEKPDDQPTTPKDDRMDPSGERASKTPNKLAGDLTNEVFMKFPLHCRVQFLGGDTKWIVLEKLLEKTKEFHLELATEKKRKVSEPAKERKVKKQKLLEPW